MEFPDVGVVPYEMPLDELRPFFIRKFRTWFRWFKAAEKGYITRRSLEKEIEEMVQGFPDNEREKQRQKGKELWDYVFAITGKEIISEEDCVRFWVDERVFTDPQTRKVSMEITKGNAGIFFSRMDLDNSGFVVKDEWTKGTRLLDKDINTNLFKCIDKNGDGQISLEEWQYAIVCFKFSSGPDDPISGLFGPLVAETEFNKGN